MSLPAVADQSIATDLSDSTASLTSTSSSSSSLDSKTVTDTSTPTLSASAHNEDSQHHPLAQILGLYHKATSTFLLRQLAAAYTTSLEALELLARTNQDYGLDHSPDLSTRRSFFVLKQKLWILHATIFGAVLSDRASAQAAAAAATAGNNYSNSYASSTLLSSSRKRISGSIKDSPEKLVKDLWRRLVDDYGGLEGDVDGQIMVSFTLLCINQKLYALARQIVEAYLATIPDDMLIHLETAAGVSLTHEEIAASGQKDPLMTNYERLVELYLIHVLAKLGEWDCATNFLQFNSVLSDSTKKTYGKILDRLHQKSLRPKKAIAKQPQQQSSGALEAKSLSTSASPSAASTSFSSPTLSSTSTMGSLAATAANSIDSTPDLLPVSNAEANGVKKSVSGGASPSPIVKTKLVTSPKQGVKTNGGSAAVSVLTMQAKLMALMQHYVEMVKKASNQMGTNQLMVIVGLVVFLGTLSRNRVKASEYFKAGMAKVMQTIRMGTTVTGI
ncbi:hypothetical protein BX616_010890 [Lobosporangium transversale]|nr:hypothetical protein BX616_010890 [Lobosporangium transversale]